MLGEKRQRKGSGIVIDEQQYRGSITLIAGIDAGSTETRVCLADAKDAAVFADSSRCKEALECLTTQYCIPSTYAGVDNAREITAATDSLEDNFDSTIMLLSNKAENPLISRQRVLRGRKIQDAMGVTPRYLDSSTNKTDNVIFYMNIIDALGYAVLQKYSGRIPEEVVLHLTLSVRPKELTSKCREQMTDNLVGEYMFAWKDIKVKFKITGLSFTTEPEAAITGTTTVYDLRALNNIDKEHNEALADKLSLSECYIHVEGGGSSIGVEVLRGGVILDACSSTFPLGGNYMAQVFIDRYREANGRTVTKEAANNALITCILRDGRNTLDVAELVSQCKDQVAMTIVENLRHEVIDVMSDLTMRDVEFVTLGGRLFKADASGATIGEYFSQYIKQISPETEVFSLPENFIAQGNLVLGINTEYAASLTSIEDVAPEEEKKEEPAPATPVPVRQPPLPVALEDSDDND